MDYNTKEGIAAELGSYASFFALMNLRRKLNSNSLESFIVLGRYISDQFGQCKRLNRELFTDSDRINMPRVMTEKDFFIFLDQEIRPRSKNYSHSIWEGVEGMAPSFQLPPPNIECAKCAGTWELEKCHDIDATGSFEDIDLSEFVGKSLVQFKAELLNRKDAVRVFSDGKIHIQNPKWVDNNVPKEWAIGEEAGWRAVDEDYVIQPGDSTTLYRYYFYHGGCFRQVIEKENAKEETEKIAGIKSILEVSGFENVIITNESLPSHISAFFAQDLDEEMTEVELAKRVLYYRINTSQGSFGIFQAAELVIDLEGSGVLIADLDPKFVSELPPDFPQIMAFTDAGQLLRLWQLLVKKQLKK